MKLPTIGIAALLAVGFANVGLAGDPLFGGSKIAAPQAAGSAFGFRLDPSYANATLSVSGPNGYHASNYSQGGSPAVDLSQFGTLADGTYTYQLTARGPETVTVKTNLDNGRGKAATTQSVGVAESGTFQVQGGRIVMSENPATASRKDH
jgi:hypothetical protein